VSTAILWFRRDLRLTDNPALQAALRDCQRLLPVYIHAPQEEAPWEPGAASRWWLHHSLSALERDLRARGSRLLITRGPSRQRLLQIAERCRAGRILWNRLYEPAADRRDAEVASALEEQGLQCASFNALLLHEPWDLRSGKGTPYRVFSAFWRACLERAPPPAIPHAAPARLPPCPDADVPAANLDALALLPKIPWDGGLREHWTPGEDGALVQLRRFLDQGLAEYPTRRDLPSVGGTSRLSAHLRFGELGPAQIRWALQDRTQAEAGRGLDKAAQAFLRQLGWREFSYHLLHHFPQLPEQPLDRRFAAFPWSSDAQAGDLLHAWQQGKTGIPIVDAGMRELWHRGWMHNRVRMLAASLLTKNLRIHWHCGARWFWDTLVDADLANNTQGWQWTAGCGADAAPYFRIFNPLLQGERFDPEGAYVRRWVPELANLESRHIHKPWLAGARALQDAGIQLGRDYPLPVVDLGESRKTALAVWERIRKSPERG